MSWACTCTSLWSPGLLAAYPATSTPRWILLRASGRCRPYSAHALAVHRRACAAHRYSWLSWLGSAYCRPLARCSDKPPYSFPYHWNQQPAPWRLPRQCTCLTLKAPGIRWFFLFTCIIKYRVKIALRRSQPDRLTQAEPESREKVILSFFLVLSFSFSEIRISNMPENNQTSASTKPLR